MFRKVPHTYAIIFYIIIIAAVMTWIIPGGEYVDKVKVVDGQEVTQKVFQYVDKDIQTWQVFSSLFKGFEKQAGIIVFILMIGGAFWIMNESKAIDTGILSFLKFTKRLEKNKFFKFLGVNNIILVLIMLLFSAFGAIFGMSEETIAFIIIFVPLTISMGYDSITGVAICFVAAGMGFAGAILNPFTIGIAQGIAEIPLFSGIEYRMFCWVIINIVGITYVLRYANRIKRKPERSLVYKEDDYWRQRTDNETTVKIKGSSVAGWIAYIFLTGVLVYFAITESMTTMKVGNSSVELPMLPIAAGLFGITGLLGIVKSARLFILNLLLFTILFLIIGVMGYGWYIMKIATLFFVMGIFSGIAMNYNPDKIVKLFLEGVKDIMPAALVVGLAAGIIVVLEDGKVIDTILYGMSKAMSGMGKMASVSIMYVIQNLINIIIPSGSAKAAITMPIMAPFSDLIGISRQATVMAYQFGDGFTNLITPTSGILIGVLGVAKIAYEKWVKWIWPLIAILLIVGLLLLIPTVTMELSGFEY